MALSRFSLCMAALLLSLATPALSHVYWIEARAVPAADNTELELVAYVGHGLISETTQTFGARAHTRLWLDQQPAKRKQVALRAQRTPLRIRRMAAPVSAISYTTRPALHRHKNFEEFSAFAREEGAETAIATHIADDLPRQGFLEQFTRYTKTLLCTTAPQDVQDTPLPFEWQVLDHPHDKTNAIIRLRLTENDQPLSAQSLVVITRNDAGEVVSRRDKTNEAGIVELDNTGSRTTLINATILRRTSNTVLRETGAIWASSWVSLFYESHTDCEAS